MMNAPQEYPQKNRPWRGVIALAPLGLDERLVVSVNDTLAKYGLKATAWFHMSLRLLLLERHLEETGRFLPEVAANYPPFLLHIEGAAFFPSSGVVYLKVRPDIVLKDMRKEIFLRQGWPAPLAWLRNLNWIPHISAAYQAGEKGWTIAHELDGIAGGQQAVVERITLRNWRDQDRCFELGSGEESCVPLVLPEEVYDP